MSQLLVRSALKGTAFAAGVAALGYAGLAGWAWWRYGSPSTGSAPAADPLLDQFIPKYDIVERHYIDVEAPAAVVMQAAADLDIQGSRLARAIFRTREVVLRAGPPLQLPRGLIAQVKALGWGELAEKPGREIVMGAVTQPWVGNVVFRALPPGEFAAFAEPDFVKIAWTLRADPIGERFSTFRTETRAVATDAAARRKFRRYWSFVSPGIYLIRALSLSPMKAEAERRAASDGS